MEELNGILLLNKDINISSRDLVNMVCKKFHTKKVGHTGTLDPFASGLMIITLNKATKISTFIEATRKKYIAELTLGITTDTLDLTGKVIDKKDFIMPSKEELEKIFASFKGEIKQIPPMYSAIKVNGVELYKLARKGEVVERKERNVTIYDLKILSISKQKIIFEVECSKGTYIRTLGYDIASKIGSGGHLSLLTRISVGDFLLKNAKSIDDVNENYIIPIEKALSFFPSLIVDEVLTKKAINGVKLSLNINYDQVLLLSKENKPIAIYERKEDGYYYSLRGLF